MMLTQIFPAEVRTSQPQPESQRQSASFGSKELYEVLESNFLKTIYLDLRCPK